jgi:hypothetical protein
MLHSPRAAYAAPANAAQEAFQPFDSAFAPNKNLHATGIADEIRLSIFVDSLIEFLTTQHTRQILHSLTSPTLTL